MIKNYFSPEVLDRSNWLVCDGCKKRCAAERHPCVRIAPNHLMVVVKRFDFDYRLVANKILDNVSHSLMCFGGWCCVVVMCVCELIESYVTATDLSIFV
jgi:hypothetical protein